jgi:Virulence factor BrkB
VSLVVSALLTALSNYLDAYLPFGHLILQALTFLISFSFITLLFGAIYKILPDRRIEWHDVMIGAVVTALLFSIGKFLIGLSAATAVARTGCISPRGSVTSSTVSLAALRQRLRDRAAYGRSVRPKSSRDAAPGLFLVVHGRAGPTAARAQAPRHR